MQAEVAVAHRRGLVEQFGYPLQQHNYENFEGQDFIPFIICALVAATAAQASAPQSKPCLLASLAA